MADFISRHGDSRFTRKPNSENRQGAFEPARDRAGWWLDRGDGEQVYLFTAEGLRDATRGHDFSRVLDALDTAGWIVDRDGGDKGLRSKRTAIGVSRPRLYWVVPGEVGE